MNNMFGMHQHHIVFRSHGGMDFPLNLVELSQEDHEGDMGPHKNRETDLMLKTGLQNKLFELFPEEELFDIDTISEKLGRTSKYFAPRFRKVPQVAGMYKGIDVVKHLMGGRFY